MLLDDRAYDTMCRLTVACRLLIVFLRATAARL